jgi:hypothetical protein
LRVKKAKISLQCPKTEFGPQNHNGHPSIRNFIRKKKKYTFRGGRKGENKTLDQINGILAPKSN